MNVLYVCPFSHGVNISPELKMAHLLANLENTVCFLTVKTPYVGYRRRTEIELATPPGNVRMFYLRNAYLLPEIAYPFVNIVKESRMLADIARQFDIDVVHFYFPEHLTCIPSLSERVIGNRSMVLSVNAIPGLEWHYGNKLVDSIGKAYYKSISSKIIRRADLIIPYSSRLKEILVDLGYDESRIENTMAHGVDTDFFKPCTDKIESRKILGLPTTAFILIYAGRLTKTKRVKFLVESFPKLKKEIPDAFLLIVGDGPEMTELVTLARSQKTDSIRFVGFVNPSKLKELYAASDAFVLLSSGEGISSALLEACSSGLPMLVSDVGANRDIVKSGENGFVMHNMQVEMLVERIVEIKHKLHFLSENSRKIALEKLDWRIVVREYLRIYERMEN